MSRIGQKPIDIPNGVTIDLKDKGLEVVGPKGKMNITVNEGLKVKKDGNQLKIELDMSYPHITALAGLNRTLISNAIMGVTSLWTKSLELVGVGYRATVTGNELTLSLGFSHPIKIIAPEGIVFAVAESKITITGTDKYLVGEEAAKIRRLKPPEPYKGKGIKYVGEIIRKKAGKATKALGGAPGAK